MTQVVELSGDEKALLQSYDRAIKKQVEFELALRNGGAAGDAAGTQIEDALNKVKRANDQALKGLLGDLKSLGPDGAAAADALKGHFVETGKAGYQSFDKILDQIRAIDPEAANAAAAARNALNEAANSSETQFHDILEEMRALGPEGRKAADAIKAKFIESGHISEKSIADIAKGFDQLDPEAAKAAQTVIDNMANAAEEAKGSWSLATEDMVAKIGTVGFAAAALKSVVSVISDELEHQKSLIADARQATMTLADAEQDAMKNMAGLDKSQQQKLLQEVVPDAVRTTNFPSRKDATLALGALISADASPEQVKPMLEATLPLTRLKTSETDEYAMAAFNIAKITGKDPKQALSSLLVGGGKALVKDPKDVALTLPTAMLVAQNNSKSDDKQLVADQAIALFGLFTDLGGDVTGRSSQTNVASFTGYLDKLFEVGNKDLNKSIESTEKAVNRQNAKISGLKSKSADQKKIIEAEAELKKLQKDLENLNAQKASIPKDPGDPLARLEAIQNNPLLKAQFLSREEGGVRGEEAFLSLNRALVDPNSDAWKKLKQKFADVRAQDGTQAYDRAVEQIAGGTPATVIASADATSRSLKEQAQLADMERATLGQVRQTVNEALSQNETFWDRAGYTVANNILTGFGLLSDSKPISIENGRLQGTTAAEEAVSGIRELASLRNAISDPFKQQQLQSAIESLKELIIKQASLLDAAGAERARQRILQPGEFGQDSATERLLQQIAAELGAIRANTGQPGAVTPKLGNQQP